MMQAIKHRWSALEEREQRLLKVAGPLVLLLLLYLLVWKPLQGWRENRVDGGQQQAQLLQLLESVRGTLVPVRALDTRQWQALAESHGLRAVQVQQQGDIWSLQGEARSIEALMGFLTAVAEQGWHWRELNLQGQPIRISVELVAI